MTDSIFDAALKAEGTTGNLAKLARSIYTQESSGGKNTKTSNAGAKGGMQILPGTFKSVADKGWDINDPLANARAGIRYLAQLDKQSGGDPVLTAAGYYGGPKGLEKARKGIAVSDPRNPNAPDTLEYGKQVATRMGITPSGPSVRPPVLPHDKAYSVQPGPSPIAELRPSIPTYAQEVTPVPVYMAQGPDPWMVFQEYMNSQAGGVVNDLSFGNPGYQVVSVNQPNFNSLASYSEPLPINFNAFKGLI